MARRSSGSGSSAVSGVTRGAFRPRSIGRRGVALSRLLGRWFSEVKDRREMPWRRTRDPYAIWLSETMLQQTRAASVVPYYERFMEAFPTVQALAEAPVADVLSLWSGLGYYRRARMLHSAAQQVVSEWGGRLPRESAALRRLDGVGAYTAGAVASIAHGERAALVDGNVTRVLSRLFAMGDDVRRAAGQAHIWKIAEALVADIEGDPGDWNQGLMELGATVCVPVKPRCEDCPLGSECAARALGIAADLPHASPKKAPRRESRVAVVLVSAKAVLLARRRPDARFGGLWEPPGICGPAGPLLANLGIEASALRSVGRVAHTLSHRKLDIEVLRGALGRRVRWPLPGSEYDAVEVVPLSRVEGRALASLSRKVLEVAQATRQGLLSVE
jgi:A/G-specific adenine glycosylase